MNLRAANTNVVSVFTMHLSKSCLAGDDYGDSYDDRRSHSQVLVQFKSDANLGFDNDCLSI